MIRRLVTIVLFGIVVPAAVLVSLGAKGAGSGYRIRAVFDNVSGTVPGEDVKIAGARVGQVESMDVTPIDPNDGLPDNKAIVVLDVTDPGFKPFRANASCIIRPQSLIGEKFVECNPGDSRAELPKVPKGRPGAGQHLLDVRRTHSPVDLDLINDVMRLPYRQRFAIVLNEFGAGLAGRGRDLNEVIHRANPALRDTDRFLNILAHENRTLGQLTADSDRVLAPLAAKRQRIADFIVQANQTAQASAERAGDISRSIQRLPSFLRALKPNLQELGALSDEMTPVLEDFDRAAPDLNRFIVQLGPFSQAGIPAIRSLGRAGRIGGPALRHARPIVDQLASFAQDALPVGKNLAAATASLDKSGGIEKIMDYLFFQQTAINGFDGISHYLRAGFISNLCSSYTTTPVLGCSANFRETRGIPAGGGKQDKTLVALQRALRSAIGAPTPASGAPRPEPSRAEQLQALTDPRIAAQREAGIRRIQRDAGAPPDGPPTGAQPTDAQMLNYLLGNDDR